jgi:hypothetical protein
MKWYSPQSLQHVRWVASMHNTRDLLFNSCPSTTHLSFSDNYNDPVGKLPLGVRHIHWGKLFNHPLPPLTPQITHLTFGRYFNQELTDLPPSLTHLYLGISWNKPLVLPLSLTHLTIACYACVSPIHPLPNLQYINIRETGIVQSFGAEMFPKLTHLLLCPSSNFIEKDFSPYLTYFFCGVAFDQPIDSLPSSLTHLVFNLFSNFNFTVDHLPLSLTHLVFGSGFNQTADNLPPALTHLKFGEAFNQPLTSLPSSITHLILGLAFRQSISALPRSITHLSFESDFPSPGYFESLRYPPKLTHLSFYQYPITLDNLPYSITHFSIFGHLYSANYNLRIPANIQFPYFPGKRRLAMASEDKNVKILISTAQQYFWDPRPRV